LKFFGIEIRRVHEKTDEPKEPKIWKYLKAKYEFAEIDEAIEMVELIKVARFLESVSLSLDRKHSYIV
jgi:hypothetical protein